MASCDHVPRMRRALLPLLMLLAIAAPAQAQSLQDRSDRGSAEEALEHVEQVIDDRGATDQRALTPALVDLARQKDDLSATDRRRARALLARPPDGTGVGAWSGLATASQAASCADHFCFHWVDNASYGDAPDLADGDLNGRPDYVDLVAKSFEQSYTTEVGTLGWRAPVSDGTRGGGNGLVDVYISDIGPTAYGYAVPETGSRSTYGYVVVDDDYNATEFPDYEDDPTIPVQATAAHEFNHILQYAYDADQDLWMLESTATWAEDEVFDDANDYLFYLNAWAARPDVPLTSPGDGQSPLSDDRKMYGSAIWNRWLERRYGAQVVRQAWSLSQANSVEGLGFAPAAYDKAIANSCGPGFTFEFNDFTASVAEWAAPNSGIDEGATFPPQVARAGTLALDGDAARFVDHAAFALYWVSPLPAGPLYLTGGLPAGTAGSIALVGRRPDGTMAKSLGLLDADGHVTVSLADAREFDRVTAVVTNADTAHDGFDTGTQDWDWRHDGRSATLAASSSAPTEPLAGPLPELAPCLPADPGPDPDPTPTTSPDPTATATATPTVTPTPTPPRTSVSLTRSTTNLATISRTGLLAFFARTNKAGRLTAKATFDRATAVRLKLGRRTTSAGPTVRRTFRAPARLKINVKLSPKVRAALKRQRGRTVSVKVRVSFTPSDGTSTVLRTLTLRLRR